MTEFYFKELFPSAIMFGMSSKDFWEGDPQLYWAYRTFYLKQKEMEIKEKKELMRYNSWLNGNMNCMAVSVALNNAFNKKKIDYPSYNKVFSEEENNVKDNKNKKDNNLVVQEEFNFWARY